MSFSTRASRPSKVQQLFISCQALAFAALTGGEGRKARFPFMASVAPWSGMRGLNLSMSNLSQTASKVGV